MRIKECAFLKVLILFSLYKIEMKIRMLKYLLSAFDFCDTAYTGVMKCVHSLFG